MGCVPILTSFIVLDPSVTSLFIPVKCFLSFKVLKV
jgi:hypothetical protein